MEFAHAQRQRKKVEALFAELKNQVGLRRVRLRRLKFVREQFFLAGRKAGSVVAILPVVMRFEVKLGSEIMGSLNLREVTRQWVSRLVDSCLLPPTLQFSLTASSIENTGYQFRNSNPRSGRRANRVQRGCSNHRLQP